MRRYDVSPLASVERTATGGIRVPATLARTGIQVYLQPDGTVRREYRPPEEVFAPSALAALRGGTVTARHPRSGEVTADEWRRLAVGHVGEDVRQDGAHVAATIYVQDAATIAEVEAGVLREVSLGYDVEYDPTPGTTPEGEPYDGIQRRIQPNHVALVERGRAGASVRLRLDSEGHAVPCYHSGVKITIGGKEYEAGTPAAAAAIAEVEARASRADALAPLVDRYRRDRLAALRQTARAHGVEPRADAEEGGIMAETIKKIVPGLEVDGRSPEWIEGAFAAAIAMALGVEDEEPADEEPAEAPAAAPPAPGPRADSAPRTAKGANSVRRAVQTRRQDADRQDPGAGLPPDEVARQRMIDTGAALYRPQTDKN